MIRATWGSDSSKLPPEGGLFTPISERKELRHSRSSQSCLTHDSNLALRFSLAGAELLQVPICSPTFISCPQSSVLGLLYLTPLLLTPLIWEPLISASYCALPSASPNICLIHTLPPQLTLEGKGGAVDSQQGALRGALKTMMG